MLIFIQNDTSSSSFKMIPVILYSYIKLLYKSGFGDPKAYLVRDTVIAIRDMDSRYIGVYYEI